MPAKWRFGLFHTWYRRRDGATAVEFALTFPVLMVALMGVIELGRLGYTQTALHFAAQEATRFAIVRDGNITDQELTDFTRGKLIGLNGNLAVVTVQSPINPDTQTAEYSVEVRYDFTPMIPYSLRKTLTLSASSQGFVAESS